MKKNIYKISIYFCSLILLIIAAACSGKENNPTEGNGIDKLPPVVADSSANNTYDVDKNGMPKFLNINYIELSRIRKISRFRSAAGHNYSDEFETNRSMKHYFFPTDELAEDSSTYWGTIKLFSPVQGIVHAMTEEWAGTQLAIQSKEYPAFTVVIFHVKLAHPLKVGDIIQAGEVLGTHIGDQTYSDVAVGVNTPKGYKLVSYFDVMTDSLFQSFISRGVNSRSALIISKEARDADPLTCDGDTFTSLGHLDDWVMLK